MPPDSDAYAGIARWYDAATSFALRGPRDALITACVRRGLSRVLDAGCGTGLFAEKLVAAGCSVTCLDSSPAMLAIAAGRLPSFVSLVRGGVPLPFPDDAFDGVVLSLVMHESENEPEDILTEALRVAPVCLVIEWRMPERNLDYLARPLVHMIERLAGKRHYARFCHFARTGYLHGAAGRAGAVVLSERAFAAGCLVLAEVAREREGRP